MARENIPVGRFYATYSGDCTYELNSRLIASRGTSARRSPMRCGVPLEALYWTGYRQPWAHHRTEDMKEGLLRRVLPPLASLLS